MKSSFLLQLNHQPFPVFIKLKAREERKKMGEELEKFSKLKRGVMKLRAKYSNFQTNQIIQYMCFVNCSVEGGRGFQKCIFVDIHWLWMGR